jgi:type I restriction enzyme M protein
MVTRLAPPNSAIQPLRRLTQAELDRFLEGAANILRGNVDHSEFRGYVFALLFFKRISDVYQEEVRKLIARIRDEKLARDPRMHNFIVPDTFLWEEIARTAPGQLGTRLNEAMIAIERANQPRFDGILTNKIDFNKQDELPREKLVNLINHFSSQPFDHAHVSDDLFGNAYEYLIYSFASKAGKRAGEIYTPQMVAYLMSEIVEPAPGDSICDWASGSAGLLLQCRRYVRDRGGDPNQLFLYAQESNVSTYNISRINMILHGVRTWYPAREDSLRAPCHLDDGRQLKRFDRILMNPPFSLEDWGYDDFLARDPFDRFTYGIPPRDSGDYAWLQHVVKSLDDDGRAIVVMSQGVLFRGQPELTEEEDGQKRKADAEYVIREGFVKADLIECVIVLPAKLFYGNNVPACLIVLNKRKPPARKDKILMIWASRHYQDANPQNLLRPSDLMRILVPWRAFGDLALARELVPQHEQRLIDREEADRARRLQDIEEAYAPLLEPLAGCREELALLESGDFKAWDTAPDAGHPVFGHLLALRQELGRAAAPLLDGPQADPAPRAREAVTAELRAATAGAKRAYVDRLKHLRREVKSLDKRLAERDAAEQEVHAKADREISHLREAAANLLRICSDPEEAQRCFAVAARPEIEENEFNLNLPRYVDTFEPEESKNIPDALVALNAASRATRDSLEDLADVLRAAGIALEDSSAD